MRSSAFTYLQNVMIGLTIVGVPLYLLYAGVTAYERAPPNSFSPFCTSTLTYRLNVTIETEGKQYSAFVVRQKLRPREWIKTLGGCYEVLGLALAFRLADNRLVLMNSYLCPKASDFFEGKDLLYAFGIDVAAAMRERHKIDVMPYCRGINEDKLRKPRGFVIGGFVVDNADHPARWKSLVFDENDEAGDIRIVSAVAEKVGGWPEDQLATVAPAILKTEFKYTNWSNSPETLIDFSRRYRPDNKFTYTAEEDPS
jgi:hypothetical protein